MLLPKDSADDGSAFLKLELEQEEMRQVFLLEIFLECIHAF
jgi:hypothetical protein